MEIYVPLSERMGMNHIRDELEDLSFQNLNPEARKLVVERLSINKKNRENSFKAISKNFTKGFYVDVGCFHPKKHSNTYLLYIKGWSGINIDMEVDKINSFKLARPSDFNVLSAVSDKNIKTKFYTKQEYGVGSTLEKDFIKK